MFLKFILLTFLSVFLIWNEADATNKIVASDKNHLAFVSLIYLGDDPDTPPACNCMNNATSLENGQFSETINIEAPSGQTWTISAVSGLYNVNSPAPPENPIPIPVGTLAQETAPGSGKYQLRGVHIDGEGFYITFSNGTETLEIQNTCYYPNPQIIGLSDQYCTSGLAVPLSGSAEGVAGTGSFTINGTPATEFDPAILGPGSHTVVYSFDAEGGTPGDSSDPACISQIQQLVTVEAMPVITMINLINVTINENCEALITPDMVMTGTYPCVNDDYIVTVFDPIGNPIGNVVSGDYLGITLTVRVNTINGAGFGTGYIRVWDSREPEIECPPDVEQASVQKNIQLIEGVLDSNDHSFLAGNLSCFNDLVQQSNKIHYYQVDTFMVTEKDIYTFELQAGFGAGTAALYVGAFGEGQDPCYRLMTMGRFLESGKGYFVGQDSIVRISSLLLPGHQYTLLSTSYAPLKEGDFRWGVYSTGNGTIDGDYTSVNAPLVMDLFCSDADHIYNNDASLLQTGYPIITDNCNDDTFTFEDEMTTSGDCGATRITRTFITIDASGLQNECQQQIRINKPSLDDVVLPPKSFIISCNEDTPLTPDNNPSPLLTGYPFVLTASGPSPLDPVFCNVFAIYSDLPRIQLCDGTYEFIRRWTLYNECSISSNFDFEQVIRVEDTTPPEIEFTLDDMQGTMTLVLTTSPMSCFANFEVPLPEITDNYSNINEVLIELISEIEVETVNALGVVTSIDTQEVVIATILPGATDFLVTDIPIGNHKIRYTASDDCGNSSTSECPFMVRDLIEPVAICDNNLHVSLNNAGYGRVYAEDIDEGSSDNCGVDHMEVRRLITFDTASCENITPYWTDWGEYIEFFCCEVNGPATIELKVIDNYGNQNICSTEIQVRDETEPTCMAPESVTIKCYDLPIDFDPNDISQLQTLFGTAEAEYNCAIVTVMEESQALVNLSNCGFGTIIRTFNSNDQNDNTSQGLCRQEITIEEGFNYKIKFPKDASAFCGVPNPDTLEFSSTACDQFVVNVTEETFAAEGAECYAIFRTYRIINQCEYDGYSDPVIIGRDINCNEEGGEEDLWLIRDESGTYLDQDNDYTNAFPAANTMGTSCSGGTNPAGYWKSSSSVGYWQYTQYIYVYDDENPEISFEPLEAACTTNNETCTAAVQYEFSVIENCSPGSTMLVNVYRDDFADGLMDGELDANQIFGFYPDYYVTADFPVGQHEYIVEVTDGCGNSSAATLAFSVVDCVAPAPACINSFSVELGQVAPGTDADGDGDIDQGAVTVYAESLVASTSPECSGALSYSINLVGNTADINQDHIILTCDEFGLQEVELYTWDNAFNPYAMQPDGTVGGPNYDYCVAYVQVQDNLFHLCNDDLGGGFVTGIIATENDLPSEGVSVNVAGQMSSQSITQQNGAYHFPSLPMGHNYTIFPQYNGDPKSGISTLDLILISKHILGVQSLDSPYKIIAADINKSKSITTLDLIHLRKLILGVLNEMPGNSSWRFIDADFEFPDPDNPWMGYIPEVINLNNFSAYEMENLNFIAIKVGDVNDSATPNSYMQIDPRNTRGSLTFGIENKTVEAENEYVVDFKPLSLDGLRGYQFTLEFDTKALRLMDVNYGLAREENFALDFSNNGTITTSWNVEEAIFGIDETMFSLVFKAEGNGNLKDMIRISSRLTEAEAYSEAGNGYYDLLDVDIQFENAKAHSGFELYQNKPNPFMGQTIIEFSLPENMPAVLKIHDVTGNEIKHIEEIFSKGYNQIRINSNDLPATGVLYYTLQADRFTATKKMIVLDR